ncbi:MAG: PilZ domain-containing protein, partial [Firmicutes bacterium]|nr:PilZ domain-containing protein [Bacillota bacterium]
MGGGSELIFFWKKNKDKESDKKSSNHKADSEKRESIRIFHAISVRSRRLPGNRGIARDISMTGVRIEGGGFSEKLEAGPPVQIGEKFSITLDLDLVSESITVFSEVVWVKRLPRFAFEAGLWILCSIT